MKKTLTTAALAVGAAMIAAVATAQTPPETLTWMVLNEINGAYFDRTEPFNRPTLVTRVPDGVIRPVDVSHDGNRTPAPLRLRTPSRPPDSVSG